MKRQEKEIKKPFRTVFKKEIVAEFLPPALNKKNSVTKIIILCQGVPSIPQKDELLSFLADKGFWVFFPRYRGTWESRGEFLKKSPHQDIIDVIDQLSKGFKSSEDEKIIKLKPEKIFVFGSSFGGAAAALASQDKRVDKTVLISPVLDWTKQNKTIEPLDKMANFLNDYFGRAYDFSRKDWNKLKTGKFYNPITEAVNLPKSKNLIIHCRDDDVVPWNPAKSFSNITDSEFLLLNEGGHLGLSCILDPVINKKIFNFIK